MVNDTQAQEAFDASDQLRALILFGLKHGIELLQKQGAFSPMIVSVNNSQYKTTVLPASTEAPHLVAMHVIEHESAEIEAYVVILPGKVPLEGRYQDAVIIMAGQRGESHGYQLAQIYNRNVQQGIVPVGQPVYGGHVQQFLQENE
jgi:hypothetical protein